MQKFRNSAYCDCLKMLREFCKIQSLNSGLNIGGSENETNNSVSFSIATYWEIFKRSWKWNEGHTLAPACDNWPYRLASVSYRQFRKVTSVHGLDTISSCLWKQPHEQDSSLSRISSQVCERNQDIFKYFNSFQSCDTSEQRTVQ
jgi:hypothetical protein